MEIPSILMVYMPSRKLGAKPLREPKEGKLATYMPLLQEEVPFKGEVLGMIPHLKMED